MSAVGGGQKSDEVSWTDVVALVFMAVMGLLPLVMAGFVAVSNYGEAYVRGGVGKGTAVVLVVTADVIGVGLLAVAAVVLTFDRPRVRLVLALAVVVHLASGIVPGLVEGPAGSPFWEYAATSLFLAFANAFGVYCVVAGLFAFLMRGDRTPGQNLGMSE